MQPLFCVTQRLGWRRSIIWPIDILHRIQLLADHRHLSIPSFSGCSDTQDHIIAVQMPLPRNCMPTSKPLCIQHSHSVRGQNILRIGRFNVLPLFFPLLTVNQWHFLLHHHNIYLTVSDTIVLWPFLRLLALSLIQPFVSISVTIILYRRRMSARAWPGS